MMSNNMIINDKITSTIVYNLFGMVARKEKKICILHELANKMQSEPLSGFSGRAESKVLEKLSIRSLK